MYLVKGFYKETFLISMHLFYWVRLTGDPSNLYLVDSQIKRAMN